MIAHFSAVGVTMATSHARRSDAASLPKRYIASWTTAGRLAEERASWRELADTAIEPNPLYGPNILVAAERRLRAGRPIPVLVVRDQSRNGALAALAPLEPLGLLEGLSGKGLRLFVNPYTSLTHPLVRREDAPEILKALLCFLAQEGRPSLLFPYLAEKRGFVSVLNDIAAAEGLELARVDGLRRPAIEPEPGASGDCYARTYVRKNRRSNTERRMRRLSDVGTVGFEDVLAHKPGGREALEAFLRMEGLGWKGEAATALLSKEETLNFAYEAFGGADGAPKVRIRSLTLDGRPIAMALDLESQNVAYAFKAAYDPAFARHAPGLTLDAHTAACIGEGFEIARLDSLAQTEIAQEGVWRQEEPIGRYVLALSAQAGVAETLAGRLRLASAARERAKALLRSGAEIASASANARRLAVALALIGVSVPLVSLLTRHLG
ncbi:MAG: hypothetical protein CTY15_03205 [Methylocystis sp.]|nr:MAG: hypothetical protein CTY15_03205 [Methylocystis sp.]